LAIAPIKAGLCALIRSAERWLGIRITEFEQRQLKATRGGKSTAILQYAMLPRQAHPSPQPQPTYPATIRLDRENREAR
jgi:hypothetical protein